MSLFLNNYRYDIYVCYAKEDAESSGWISTIFHYIKTLVPKKLAANNSLSIVMEYDPPYDILNQSALVVLMLSSKYLDDNIEFINQLQFEEICSRIIVIEIEEKIERPEPLKGLFEYKFGIFDHTNKTIKNQSKKSKEDVDQFDEPFYDLITGLCNELVQKLTLIKAQMSNDVEESLTVFLAEVTDDLYAKREDMKRYLTQANYKILPEISLYQQFHNQKEQLEQQLQLNIKECHCFVQLLSEKPGEKIIHLNKYYPYLQYEIAVSILSKNKILQWREPKPIIDKQCANKQHLHLLKESTVHEMILNDFKTEINHQLLNAPVNHDVLEKNDFIYIIANQKDYLIAEKIKRLLGEKNYNCIQRTKGSSVIIRSHLNQYLRKCKSVIIVCKSVTPEWIKRQINYCMKVLRTNNTALKPIALYLEIQEPDFLKKIDIPELILIENKKHLCESIFEPFLNRIQQTSTDKIFNHSNPYPGLRSFKQNEDIFYFGREHQISESLNNLEKSPFMAVIGPTGSGKSSFIHAGLWPSIEGGFLINAEDNWRLVHMTPGKTPVENLSMALVEKNQTDTESQAKKFRFLLAKLTKGDKGLFHALTEKELPDNTNFLIIVDQFEQLFLFKEDIGKNKIEQFSSLLTHVINEKDERLEQKNIHIFVVITIRSDCLGECASIVPVMFNEIMKCNILLDYLECGQIRDLINKVSLVSGITIQNTVIEAIYNQYLEMSEYKRDQFYIPLVQHILKCMWNSTTKISFSEIVFTYNDYINEGGIEKALFNHAEKLYNQLDHSQQCIAKLIFTSIINSLENTFEIHNPISISDLSDIIDVQSSEIEKVLNIYCHPENNFFTCTLQTELIIDICNIILIHYWPTLKQWIQEEYQQIQKYKQIENYAIMAQNDFQLMNEFEIEPINLINREAWAAHNGINYELVLKAIDKKGFLDEKQKKFYEKFNEFNHAIQKELNSIIYNQFFKRKLKHRLESILNNIHQLEKIYHKFIATNIPVKSKYKYDVALSFLGQDRYFAKKLFQHLKKNKLTVFFDENEQHDITGKIINEHLYSIYRNKAERCVILYSKDYQNSQYTRTEMEAAKDREKISDEYIILVSLDGTAPHGRTDIAYIEKKKEI